MNHITGDGSKIRGRHQLSEGGIIFGEDLGFGFGRVGSSLEKVKIWDLDSGILGGGQALILVS